jgi:hypothetical protein
MEPSVVGTLDAVHEIMEETHRRAKGPLAIKHSNALTNLVVIFLAEIRDDIRWDIAPNTGALDTFICPDIMADLLKSISNFYRRYRPKIVSVYCGRPVPARDAQYDNLVNHLMTTTDKIATL